MISVIIPIYNVEKYLDRCIQSLIRQTYRDLEIILVDDGSPDRCPQMCDEYEKLDSRIKVIHKENAGQGLARNDGLELAKGEYVTFVDSDDFLALNAIELMLDATEQGKHDIVCAAFYNSWTPEKGGNLAYSLDEVKSGSNEVSEALADLTAAPWDSPLPAIRFMGACGTLIRTRIIKENNLKFRSERQVISEDLLFLYDLYPYVSSIRYIPEGLYYYCLNTASTSRTFKSQYIECIDILMQYLLDSRMAKESLEIQDRILKLIIYKCGILQSQIFQSDLSLKEKYRLSHLIYKKTVWQNIIERYPTDKLPHSYRYYLSVFVHKRFFMAYMRLRLYALRKRIGL
ncbi:MAG: glycosyltransferase family 2 protein [Clostridium sp.]|nr:glycosyltransferase family 2 protein [Clostridium sp.]